MEELDDHSQYSNEKEDEQLQYRLDQIRDSISTVTLWAAKGSKEQVVPHPIGPPMIVAFGDIRDPMTIHEIKPDEFQQEFGRGFALRAIRIRPTEEPITYSIKRYLPWLKTQVGSIAYHNTRSLDLSPNKAQNLSEVAFIRGEDEKDLADDQLLRARQ